MVRIYGVCVTLHVLTTSLPAAKITSTRPSELMRVRVFLTPSFNVPLTQPSNVLSKQRIFFKKEKKLVSIFIFNNVAPIMIAGRNPSHTISRSF